VRRFCGDRRHSAPRSLRAATLDLDELLPSCSLAFITRLAPLLDASSPTCRAARVPTRRSTVSTPHGALSLARPAIAAVHRARLQSFGSVVGKLTYCRVYGLPAQGGRRGPNGEHDEPARQERSAACLRMPIRTQPRGGRHIDDRRDLRLASGSITRPPATTLATENCNLLGSSR